jgi:hypothetical protein
MLCGPLSRSGEEFRQYGHPIDYKKAGMFTVWLDKRYFDIDKLVDTFGSMPADMIRLRFKLLKPTMDLSTSTTL